ncbi:OTU domain containin protein [Tieghemostelium lacteum]|uniref:OTU domain containin protein n=1 Tax=Tieghemostelium lacteum TaxID=361077 RepID=A0A151Z2P5_TIELA|nr:OTU domain containin protein [Tieghemostelium lacteum]|eukprot:KYQ88221.1 OTU domain containin protein [Tieghemostelium lacteum]
MGGKKQNKLKINLNEDDESTNENVNTQQTNVESNNKDKEEEKVIEEKEEEEDEEDEEVKKESKGKMIQRHKMELKKLQQELDKQNHAIPKKDKKLKNEFQEKAKKQEEDLIKRQKAELLEIEKVEQEALQQQNNDLLLNKQSKGPSKGYLKKSKKIEQEEKRMKELEEDKKNFVSKSKIEMDEFIQKLQPLGKTVKHINPDGDCMYSAITDQLLLLKVIKDQDYKTYPVKLRKMASDWILAHPDDYCPFILADEDYASSETPLLDYCQEQVLTIGKWGGQIELKALSHCLQSRIVIYHSNSKDIIIGEEFNNSEPLNLSYHKHAFTLGEHYNSVVPLSNNNNTH